MKSITPIKKNRLLAGRYTKIFIGLCLLIPLVIAIINFWIIRTSQSHVFTDLNDLPVNEVGLVLGASPRLLHGPSPYFRGRVRAAARLYHEGKIRHLLISGDSHASDDTFDEPAEMEQALLKLGVPESAMTLDDMSTRTLDSVARAKEVFGLNQLTIITDHFHTYRALFLSKHYGIEAVAFSSADIPFDESKRNTVREWMARVLAVADVYLLHTSPKVLGPKVGIKLE